MIGRCYIPSNSSYERYAARGIKVCDEWKDDFDTFRKWAYENGYDENALRGECTIDRINNDGNYCPENCRFVSIKTQNLNKRNVIIVSYNGQTKPLISFADEFGIDRGVVKHRYLSKFPLDKVFYKGDLRESNDRKNSITLTYEGRTMNISKWMKELGVSRDIIRDRIKKGLSDKEIIDDIKRKYPKGE
jgi:hypothetical protein